MATLLPEGKQSYTNNAGQPLAGGRLYTYAAGTNTPKSVYQDAAGTVPHTNPVALDARGEAAIFWSGAYKVVLRDASDVLVWTVDNLVSPDTFAADLTTTLRSDLATSTDPTKGAGQVGYSSGVNYPLSTVGFKLRQTRTFKDYGAVGDGVADDTAAIAAAIASNGTIADDSLGGVYRITSQIAIPDSCFTKFVGSGNIPIHRSKFFVDFSGAAFKGAAGSTSFFSIENFYCYSLSTHLSAQLIDHDGDCVHSKFERLVLRNFRGKAIDLNTAFRCEISFLGQYCWDYMLRIGGGSASYIKFTADHSYAGGIDVGGGGHFIEAYTEQICSDNNPAGANASWREIIFRGGPHYVVGGVLSVHPQNNKFPISLQAARAVKFESVSGFSLGAAPYWIDVPFNDSSCDISTSPTLTLGGAAAGVNTITSDPGYVGTPPRLKLGLLSVPENLAFAGCSFDAGGTASGVFRVAVSKLSTGRFQFTWAAGLVSGTGYHIDVAIELSGVVVGWRVSARTLTGCVIDFNNTASAASVDPNYASIRFYPPLA